MNFTCKINRTRCFFCVSVCGENAGKSRDTKEHLPPKKYIYLNFNFCNTSFEQAYLYITTVCNAVQCKCAPEDWEIISEWSYHSVLVPMTRRNCNKNSIEIRTFFILSHAEESTPCNRLFGTVLLDEVQWPAIWFRSWVFTFRHAISCYCTRNGKGNVVSLAVMNWTNSKSNNQFHHTIHF